MENLTAEQEYEVYLKVKRELDRQWRTSKQSEESKAKKRAYMREYMKKYRANV